MQNRFEPHSHSEYSNIRLLDSTNKVDKLIEYAHDIGLKGIALTDHECLSGTYQANQLGLKYQEDGFKVGLGNEIYLTSERSSGQKDYHFILIAKDAIGYKQLRRLSSKAWMNSYSDRVPTLYAELKEEVEKDKGHLIATSACLGGCLSSHVEGMLKARSQGESQEAAAHYQAICGFIKYCTDLFQDDFYIECAPGASKEQIEVNKKLIEIARVFNIKMVIGCDSHYLTEKDRFVHKAFLNSKESEREVDAFYQYCYLQTEEEIKKNLEPSIADAYEWMCANSMEIYDKIEVYDLSHAQTIPKVEVKNYPKKTVNITGDPVISSMYSSDDIYERYWINQCEEGLKRKCLDTDKQYWDRLEYEADIKKTIGEKLHTNMFCYPITLQHYVDLFWECGSTVGAGRGSSCSGLNHWLLGVTQLNPIKYNFPFWRYLNKERVELGDIDIDIAPSRKQAILAAIRAERGGKFKASIDPQSRANLGCAALATFGTESCKSAILTSCRGYRSEAFPDGIDTDTAQYLSSLVPQERGFIWPLKDVVYGNPEKDRKKVDLFINEVSEYPGLLDIMFGIEGLISRRGIHASGVIFADEDPYEFMSYMRAPNGEITTAFDLHTAEAMGTTKYDMLVTDVQDKIVTCIKFLQKYGKIDKELTIRQVYEKYLDPNVLDLDNPEVWDNIKAGKVLNIFQFDSDVGSQAIKKVQPTSLTELTDSNGLLRLMPSNKNAETPLDKYVRFKKNISLWYKEMDDAGLTKYEQSILEPYFKQSFGVPPSQEQMMMILMDEKICNFTLKEANNARKIVGKKKMDQIPMLHEKVLSQAASPALGKYVWDCGIGPQMG